MSFDAGERVLEGITILDLHGDLVLGDHTRALRSRIQEFVQQGQTSLILNLKSVPYIDSSGLGVLVASHSEVSETGGALKLLHLAKRHFELLVITKLNMVFETFDDETAAIDSFFPDRKSNSFDILEFVQSQVGEAQHLDSDGNEPPTKPASGKEE